MSTIVLVPVVLDGITDNSTIINTVLADPATSIVLLPEGDITVSFPVVIPTGKTLRGVGRGRTVIKALPDFENVVGAAVVRTEDNASEVAVFDLTIDASKVGLGEGSLARRNGLLFSFARHFTVKRVDVKNCTGYGHFAAGQDGDWSTMAEYGLYEDCRIENCQVHYEQLFARHITLKDCHSGDGDGDITCLSWFHPFAGSTDIVYQRCTARGHGMTELTATGRDIERVKFVDCDIHVVGTTVAFATTVGVESYLDIEIVGTRIHSDGGIGLALESATCRIISSDIRGYVEGARVSESHLETVGTRILGVREASETGTAFGVTIVGNTSSFRATGGRIEAAGAPGLMVAINGGNAVLSNVDVVPSTPPQAIRQRFVGNAGTIQSAAANTCYAVLALPFTIADWSKVHVSVGVSRTVHDGSYLPAAYGHHVSKLSDKDIVIVLSGVNLATDSNWLITAEVVERA